MLLPIALDVTLDRRVGAPEAMLRDEALEDALRSVALLVPVPAVLLEPLVDQGNVVVQHGGHPPFCGDLRGQVIHPDVFAHSRLRDVVFLDISAIDAPSRCICLISCITGILIISFPTSLVED